MYQKFPTNSHNPQPIYTTLLITYSYISFSEKQREHSDWWIAMYDLPYSISKCRQGLRSVNDGALLCEDDVTIQSHGLSEGIK